MDRTIFVNFLPWLNTYYDITLEKITFWNFDRESNEKITDTKLRNRLKRHFKSYKSINGLLNSITICSFEGKSFYDNLNETEFNRLRQTITALTFASTVKKIENRIQKTQKHQVPPSMNAFDLMSRQLNFDSKYYSHASLSLLDHGMQEGHTSFHEPFGVRGEISVSMKWLKYLSAYLALKDSSKLKNRISRSLEFFRLAQAQDDLKDNSQDSAFLTRTVLLATAFESLLDFPKNDKSGFFADYIDSRFTFNNSRKSTRKFWNKKRTTFQRKNRSIVAWWAYDFYKLRNTIVQGNKVDSEKLRFKKGLWFSQMDVAVLVFADCLEEIIRTKKVIKADESDLLIDDIFESRGIENWKKNHKVLGWVK